MMMKINEWMKKNVKASLHVLLVTKSRDLGS